MTSLLDRTSPRTASRFPVTAPAGERPGAPPGSARLRPVPAATSESRSARPAPLVLWHDEPAAAEGARGEVDADRDAAALRTLVADHVGAAGAELRDAGGADAEAPGRCVLHLCTPSALLAAPATGHPRCLVVTDRPVSEPVWRRALEQGAAAVVRLPEDSPRLLALLGSALRPRERAQVVGVVGGCGGAGASSLAARLAGAAARRGSTSVLIDADPLGGGLDALVEAPDLEGASWEDLSGIDPADGDLLVDGLPEVDDVHLLVSRESPSPSAMQLDHVLAALDALTARVVVDLAPDLVGPAVPHLDRLYVLVPATDHALRAAERRIASWHLPTGIAEAVLRGRGPVTPADLRECLHLPVAGRFQDSPPSLVPLLDVRRRGADGFCRRLVAGWEAEQ